MAKRTEPDSQSSSSDGEDDSEFADESIPGEDEDEDEDEDDDGTSGEEETFEKVSRFN